MPAHAHLVQRPRLHPLARFATSWLLIATTALAAPGPGHNATPTNALSRDRLLFYTDHSGTVRPVTSIDEWQTRRAAIVEAMQSIMGKLPGPAKRCPLEVKVENETDCGEYVRQSISYAAEPGSRVPAYLLIPKLALKGNATVPAMLTLHQTHAAGRKVVVGLGDSPDDEYGVELVRRGYVCLAPPYTLLADYQVDPRTLGHASGTMMAIWNNLRGVDLLQSLPYVRTNAIGTIGHSLGGHNSVFTAVFDPRIKVVVSSCGLDSFRDYYDGDPRNWAPERGWCQTRYMPGLAAYQGRLDEIPFDFPELLAAIAPRGVFINAPILDSNFRWRSVHRVTGLAREVFALHGASARLRVEFPDSVHRFPPEIRQEAYRFIDSILQPPATIPDKPSSK